MVQFRYNGQAYPTVVIEVAESESTKSVEARARKWIVESDARTRTVIIADLPYPDPGIARYSIFAVQTVEEGGHQVDDVIARRRDVAFASPDPARPGRQRRKPGSFPLSLSDFVPASVFKKKNLGFDPSISIDHKDLFKLWRDALRLQAQEDQQADLEETPRNWKKRKFSSSPEQLGTDDERRFQEMEERTAQRAGMDAGGEYGVRGQV